MKTTTRPFQFPEKLIEVYRWMNEFEISNRYKPSHAELVEAGLAASTSVVRYYFDEMENLNMIFRPRKIFPSGNTSVPDRSNILLPLEQADPIIQKLIEKESP